LEDRYLESTPNEQVVSPEFFSKHRLLEELTILLVEDNAINQLVAKEILEAEGAMVLIASNGLEAIKRLNESSSIRYDIILMDVQMPVMDGYTATKEIRKGNHLPTIPIIAMTANALDSDKKEAFEAGMNAHVSKPFDADDLIKQIYTLIKQEAFLTPVNLTAIESTSNLPIVENPVLNTEGSLKRFGGNEGLYNKALAGYLQTAPTLWAQLMDTLDANDSEAFSSLLHTFRGMASTVGTDRFVDKLKKIEADVKAGALLIHSVDLHELNLVYQTTIEEIEMYIKQNEVIAPTNKKHSINESEFLINLKELKLLLKASNMKAINVFNDLNRVDSTKYNPLLSELQIQIDRLDFSSAASTIEEYFDNSE